MKHKFRKFITYFYKNDILWLFVLLLFVFISWTPFVVHSKQIVDIGDWDMFAAFYESVRKNIIEYKQFPFWNPWHFGGTPLFARPQISVFGLETIFVIVFGTINGLRYAMLAYTILGAIGMWFLLGDFVKSPIARFWGTMVFAMQGAVATHIAAGHTIMIAIFFVPYLMYFLRRVKKSLNFALLFGFFSAMMINHSLHYVSLTIACFVGIYLFVEFLINFKNKDFIINLTAAVLIFLNFCIYRLIVTLHLLSEFPRTISLRADIPLKDFLISLIYPGQSLFTFPGPLKLYWSWLEISCYVGVFSLLLFFISMRRELKWWHLGALLTALLTINSTSKWLPGYWLRELPVFNSFFCITRWRMLMVFFIAIGCARGADWLIRVKLPPNYRKIMFILLCVSATGFFWNLHVNWRDCPYTNESKLLASVNGDKAEYIKTISEHSYKRYASVHNNLAQLFAYEPLWGYALNKHNARLTADNPAYRSEIYPITGKVNRLNWRPNTIEIDTVSNAILWINQNPGNYWRTSDGEKLFPKMKSFEVNKRFFIKFDSCSKVFLKLLPPLHDIALLANGIVIIFFLLLLLVLYRKQTRQACSESESTTNNSA